AAAGLLEALLERVRSDCTLLLARVDHGLLLRRRRRGIVAKAGGGGARHEQRRTEDQENGRKPPHLRAVWPFSTPGTTAAQRCRRSRGRSPDGRRPSSPRRCARRTPC